MDQLLQFIELTKQFKAVKRMVKFSDGTQENDVEHSYQLAMTAWYIIEANKLPYNMELVFKYALAHDLVEAYAGDTPAAVLRSFENERQTKVAREKEAAEQLHKKFPEFHGLHQIIEAYEERGDEESKLVYALDKLLPVLNIYPDNGYSWKINDVRIDDVIAYKKEQIAESPDIKKYFDELVPLIKNLPGLS